MHPSIKKLLSYFAFSHLPEKLQNTSKPIGELAEQMATTLPDCAEKTAGMRKLLEAKDCFVRASLTKVIEIGSAVTLREDPDHPAMIVDGFKGNTALCSWDEGGTEAGDQFALQELQLIE